MNKVIIFVALVAVLVIAGAQSVASLAENAVQVFYLIESELFLVVPELIKDVDQTGRRLDGNCACCQRGSWRGQPLLLTESLLELGDAQVFVFLLLLLLSQDKPRRRGVPLTSAY